MIVGKKGEEVSDDIDIWCGSDHAHGKGTLNIIRERETHFTT